MEKMMMMMSVVVQHSIKTSRPRRWTRQQTLAQEQRLLERRLRVT